MNNEDAEARLDRLRNNIKKYGKAVIAFSGGVDSSFLLAVSADVLGKDNIVAVTASSETFTDSELILAKETAEKTGVKHVTIDTSELDNPAFTSNTAERCYYCKKDFYSKILRLSEEIGIDTILDGSNADDISDYRPGYKAVRELGIKSPFVEEGLTKKDIRAYSKSMNLPLWDKPANACLASRIPYGSVITKEKLETIHKAETFIRNKGFDIVRVRYHDLIARIEIPGQDLKRFMQDNIREEVNSYIKSLGFLWITIDIEGYRTGKLNDVLDKKV